MSHINTDWGLLWKHSWWCVQWPFDSHNKTKGRNILNPVNIIMTKKGCFKPSSSLSLYLLSEFCDYSHFMSHNNYKLKTSNCVSSVFFSVETNILNTYWTSRVKGQLNRLNTNWWNTIMHHGVLHVLPSHYAAAFSHDVVYTCTLTHVSQSTLWASWGNFVSCNFTYLIIQPLVKRGAAPSLQLHSCSVDSGSANMPLEAESWRTALMESRFLTVWNSKHVVYLCVIANIMSYLCLNPNSLSDRWRLLWICCSFCTLADILRNNDLLPLKCVDCQSFRSSIKYKVICFSLRYEHDKHESQDLTWALCFALCSLWISRFIVLSASGCLHGCIRFLDLPLKELLVGLSVCRKLDERAACWALVRGSFVFLLLSASWYLHWLTETPAWFRWHL